MIMQPMLVRKSKTDNDDLVACLAANTIEMARAKYLVEGGFQASGDESPPDLKFRAVVEGAVLIGHVEN